MSALDTSSLSLTGKSRIMIAACVSDYEREALHIADQHVARVLSQVSGNSWRCKCAVSFDLEEMPRQDAATLMVASLLPELKNSSEPWSRVEDRLRASYAALCERGIPVFVCTILRHLRDDVEPKAAAVLRLRIRQLNLLITELSRELGLFVIDIDRILSDAGARRFQTDYRLAGRDTAETVGHFLALTLITNGVDALVPVETQDAARQLLVSAKPPVPGIDVSTMGLAYKRDLLSLGQGRRKQKVATVAYTVEDNYAGWLVGQVLRGSIGPAEAMQRLINAVRRRGVWQSASMLASGLSRQVNRKK